MSLLPTFLNPKVLIAVIVIGVIGVQTLRISGLKADLKSETSRAELAEGRYNNLALEASKTDTVVTETLKRIEDQMSRSAQAVEYLRQKTDEFEAMENEGNEIAETIFSNENVCNHFDASGIR